MPLDGAPGLGSLRVGHPRWGPRSPRRDAVTARPVPPWASLVAPLSGLDAGLWGATPVGRWLVLGLLGGARPERGQGEALRAGSTPQPPTARGRRALPARWRPLAVALGRAWGAGEPFLRLGVVRIRGCPLLRAFRAAAGGGLGFTVAPSLWAGPLPQVGTRRQGARGRPAPAQTALRSSSAGRTSARTFLRPRVSSSGTRTVRHILRSRSRQSREPPSLCKWNWKNHQGKGEAFSASKLENLW